MKETPLLKLEGFGQKHLDGFHPAVEEIKTIERATQEKRTAQRPSWPVIVLRTPKGWTGPRK